MRGRLVLHAQPGPDPPSKNEKAAPAVGEPGRGVSKSTEAEVYLAPADKRDAEWFGALYREHGFGAGVHLRRIHYRLISQEMKIQLPLGGDYVNTTECWLLLYIAALQARYAGLVYIGDFIDQRNPDIELEAPLQQRRSLGAAATAGPTLHEIARALGGEIVGEEVLAPGPGHSAKDRSLSVKASADAPDGFVVHSFADDDPIICKDYVRARLGRPPFKPNGDASPARRRKIRTINYDYRDPSGALRPIAFSMRYPASAATTRRLGWKRCSWCSNRKPPWTKWIAWRLSLDQAKDMDPRRARSSRAIRVARRKSAPKDGPPFRQRYFLGKKCAGGKHG